MARGSPARRERWRKSGRSPAARWPISTAGSRANIPPLRNDGEHGCGPRMKSGWTRDRPEIELDGPAIAELVAPLFPGSSVAGYARVAGGLINTNIKVTTSGRAKPVLLRLSQRDPASARKEVAVTARIAGAVPVAPFLYFSEHNSITGRPYAIAEWIDGEPLDRIRAFP